MNGPATGAIIGTAGGGFSRDKKGYRWHTRGVPGGLLIFHEILIFGIG